MIIVWLLVLVLEGERTLEKYCFLSRTEVRFICFLCLFVSATYFQQKTAVSVKNRPAGSIRILKVAN